MCSPLSVKVILSANNDTATHLKGLLIETGAGNFDEVRVMPTAHIGWGDLPVGSADPREHSVKPAYFEQMMPQFQEGGPLCPSALRAQGDFIINHTLIMCMQSSVVGKS